MTVQQLKLANNMRGNNLRRGQSLIIPNGGRATQVAQSKPQQLASRSGGKVNYQVRSGDNLWSISQAHGVTHADLAKWNGLNAKVGPQAWHEAGGLAQAGQEQQQVHGLSGAPR